MAKNQQKNSAYWRKRFEQMEDAQHNTSQKQIAMMQEQFDRTQAVISGKINAWYQRFAENNGVSMSEAKRMLSAQELKELKWNVEDYIKYGKENKVSGAWMKQLENASARVHISRMEALKLEVQQEAEKLFGNYEDSVDSHIRDVYANDFYHTAYEIQKGIGVGSRLNALDNNVVSKIISKPWAVDGKNFSERIWESKTKLINNVHNSLTKMCITGEAPDRAIREIANSMKVSKSQAGRLVMTESAAFANKAREDCMNELGVEEFEFCATLDSITSEICQEMDGRHYPMSEHVIGVTAPPMHPNCRSCTCPYFDDEFTLNEKRAARGDDGKTYYVSADTTYKEWKSAFVASKNQRIAKKLEIDENVSKDDAVFGKALFRTGSRTSQEYAIDKRPLGNFRAVPRSKVVNVLRTESEQWLKTLSNEEKRALRKYTFNSGDSKENRFYKRLNAMLRGEVSENDTLRNYANIISGALKKSSLTQDVICYRSASVNPVAGMADGKIIKLGQFLSTSVVESKAFKEGVQIVIYAKKGTHGAYIETLSHFPKQRELLLDKDCVYRVISNKDNLVELEVI